MLIKLNVSWYRNQFHTHIEMSHELLATDLIHHNLSQICMSNYHWLNKIPDKQTICDPIWNHHDYNCTIQSCIKIWAFMKCDIKMVRSFVCSFALPTQTKMNHIFFCHVYRMNLLIPEPQAYVFIFPWTKWQFWICYPPPIENDERAVIRSDQEAQHNTPPPTQLTATSCHHRVIYW